MNKRKIKVYYINNTDWALYNFRYPVLQALRRMGFYTGAAASRGKFWTKITDIDDLVPITNYRRKINPLRDTLLVIELFSVFLRRKPDIAHFFTIKPVIYGSLAAKLAGVPYIIQTISGLGTVFTDKDVATTLLRKFIITPLYKLICSFSSFIFFQNDDDQRIFIDKGIISKNKSDIIPGSGVDTTFFTPSDVNTSNIHYLRKELALTPENVVIIMISRMLHAKGVAEYVAAARQTKTLHPQAVFLLVGPSDPNNPSAVPVAQLEAWSAAGAVRYCGRRDDIKDLLALSDLVVFPSYYREGIPKVLLEAAAMAKPIITTDIPGCRDVVTHNRTGLLVPPRDVPHLSEAISTLLLDQQLRTRLGAAARIRITTRFDISYVVDKTASKYSELLGTRRKL